MRPMQVLSLCLLLILEQFAEADNVTEATSIIKIPQGDSTLLDNVTVLKVDKLQGDWDVQLGTPGNSGHASSSSEKRTPLSTTTSSGEKLLDNNKPSGSKILSTNGKHPANNEILIKDEKLSENASSSSGKQSVLRVKTKDENLLDNKISSDVEEFPTEDISQINYNHSDHVLPFSNENISSSNISYPDEHLEGKNNNDSEENTNGIRKMNMNIMPSLIELDSSQSNYNNSHKIFRENKARLGCNRIAYTINTNRTNKWKALPEAQVPPYPLSDYNWIHSRLLKTPDFEKEIECSSIGCLIPDFYDSRKTYPMCKSIQEPLDQGCNCRASWAVSAASAFSDRLCIHTDGEISPELSAQEVLSCCDFCGSLGGCEGGYSLYAWMYFHQRGVLTGSKYGQKRGCQPYTIKPCMTKDQILRPVTTPKCSKKCLSSYFNDKKPTRYKAARVYTFKKSTVLKMKKEIFFRGPVTADIMVYEDLHCYASGIYNHVVGDRLGYTAVKIIGWGVEHGIHYWLAANTWGAQWGENGFFRVRMESDQSNMESAISAGIPLL